MTSSSSSASDHLFIAGFAVCRKEDEALDLEAPEHGAGFVGRDVSTIFRRRFAQFANCAPPVDSPKNLELEGVHKSAMGPDRVEVGHQAAHRIESDLRREVG